MVTGTIREAEGQTLALELWATFIVDAVRTSVRADEGGRYAFENVPPGEYYLAVTSESEKAASQTILQVMPGRETTLNWTFKPETLGAGGIEPATFLPAEPVFMDL